MAGSEGIAPVRGHLGPHMPAREYTRITGSVTVRGQVGVSDRWGEQKTRQKRFRSPPPRV